jgi:cell division protease FtsH
MKILFYTVFLLSTTLTFSFNNIKNNIKKISSFKLSDSKFNGYGMSDKISFGKLMENIENHNVDNIYFTEDLRRIYTKHKNEDDLNTYTVTSSNPQFSNKIIELSDKNHIDTIILESSTNPISSLIGIAGNVFDILFIVIIVSTFISFLSGFGSQNPMGRGSLTSGLPFSSNRINDNRNKINILKANNVSLSSWAGSKEIFEECTEIVSYLKNSTLYKNVGAEIPKGILLEGPPGTGKTLIAKAIASEAEANFISISASEFVELFVGLGAAKVRNLFKEARDNSPAIIFIDEIDSVGRQRGAGINMGNDEREQTLNQLLAEMDGFTANEGVIVIAATNRKDVLDAALLRPGRFDRIINVPLPDKSSRKDILSVYIKNKNVEENINIDFLAELSAGFSGAQIKNLINEAAINAARLGNTIISQKNIEDALEKIIVGIVKKIDSRSEDAQTRVAIHELGHAILAAKFKEYFELKKVTIQSTYNGAGGYTIFSEYPDISESGLYTKDLLKKRLVIALGGKAAEYIFYGENYVSLGAVQDLKQANSLAQRMVGNYGMGKELQVFYNENIESERNPFLGRSFGMTNKYSEKTKEKMDNESLDLINDAFEEAISILLENKLRMNILIKILLDSTTLSGKFIYDNLEISDNNKK